MSYGVVNGNSHNKGADATISFHESHLEPNGKEMDSAQSVEVSSEDLGPNTQQSQRDENTADKGDVPKVGMAFGTLEDLFEFYWKFAEKEGFGVIKQSCGKGLNGELKYQTFSCDRAGKASNNGKNRQKPRPTKRNGCSARVCASIGPNGKWKVNKVVLQHTHELIPYSSQLLRHHRVIAQHRKRNLEINDVACIQPCKSARATEVGAHDNMTSSSKDSRNHIEISRRINLNGDDAKVLPSPDAYKKLYEDRTCLLNMLRNEVRKMFGRLPTLLDPSIFKSIILIADDPLSTLVDLFETEIEENNYSPPNSGQTFLRDDTKT
ncbi:hypothetical protein JCGZ_02926 [Jatropha curcas]|uniref:FAR1 domain-containing protein n=1 Tax=Jatropha curcas TaxID=180498 RepID=A0A067L161_JATCU|nr:protein FAR1-RELATED SEQUENCE 5 [Jatropha curcas]XP_020533366.1 protein FAR1-RELATED SEQUENCE 5 [Jatropha curcas]KDP42196.1 hypothetical protein JCGZ_02926 [Jatropha curcas]